MYEFYNYNFLTTTNKIYNIIVKRDGVGLGMGQNEEAC